MLYAISHPLTLVELTLVKLFHEILILLSWVITLAFTSEKNAPIDSSESFDAADTEPIPSVKIPMMIVTTKKIKLTERKPRK